MMRNVANPLQSVRDNKLRSVLEGIPHFKSRESLLRMYVAYEFPSEQEYLIKFWENTIQTVVRNYFNQVSVHSHLLKNCFVLDHLEPACFYSILKILVEKRVFITADQLHTPETYKELGLQFSREIARQSAFQTITSIFNPFSYFSRKQEVNLVNVKLIDLEFLKKNIKRILREFGECFKGKTLVSEDEFDEFLMSHLNLPKEDLRIYKELLVEGGKMKTERVEIGLRRLNIFVFNPNNIDVTVEKTAFLITFTISYYEKKIEELDSKILDTHEKALNACQLKRKEEAKQLLKRQRMFEEAKKQYIDKKYICENHLLKIETSTSNKEIVSLLQYVKNAHDELKIDPDEMFNIAESLKEANEERKETGMIIENMANAQDVEEEYRQLERSILMENPQNRRMIIEEDTSHQRHKQMVQSEEHGQMHEEEDNSMNIELLN